MKQPKSQKIHTILQELQVPVQRALHFGDMVSDILYSHQVPISFCAVGWGYHPIEYLRAFDPEYYVQSPADLRNFLFNIIHLQPNELKNTNEH